MVSGFHAPLAPLLPTPRPPGERATHPAKYIFLLPKFSQICANKGLPQVWLKLKLIQKVADHASDNFGLFPEYKIKLKKEDALMNVFPAGR